MDFEVAEEITAAMKIRLEHPIYGYTHVPGRLNELVIERMQRLYQWSVKPEWLVWLPGVVTGVNVACRSLGNNGDQILSPAVVYPHITQAPTLHDRCLQQVPMVLKYKRWIMDLAWLAARSDAKDKALLLCNPHNPGGGVYRHDELMTLAGLAESKNLVIVSDEVHCDLILQPGLKHIPIASLHKSIEKRCITLMAASKTFNLAGLGCAFAIIPDPKLRKNFKWANQGIVPYVNLMGYISTQAAYQHGEKWHQQVLDYLRGNRDYLVDKINQIQGLKLDPIEATYLAWIDVSALQLGNPQRFFEAAGVGCSAGSEFGDNDFIRLNFGCSRNRLEQAVARIHKTVIERSA